MVEAQQMSPGSAAWQLLPPQPPPQVALQKSSAALSVTWPPCVVHACRAEWCRLATACTLKASGGMGSPASVVNSRCCGSVGRRQEMGMVRRQ